MNQPPVFQNWNSNPIPICGEKRFSQINALGPQKSEWTIRVQLTNIKEVKQRWHGKNKREMPVLNFVLTDAEGTQVGAAFWGELAELYSKTLIKGKVYYFTNFKVKHVKMVYSISGFPYELMMNKGTVVEEYENDAGFDVGSALELTSFKDLHSKINQGKVNVLGIVKQVHELIERKRKKDGSNLFQRKLTIVDQNRCAVTLNLWDELAQNLGDELKNLCDLEDHPVILANAIRVTDFERVSLSTIADSSRLSINPSISEAYHLKNWYYNEGRNEGFMAINEGLKGLYFRSIDVGTIKEVLESPLDSANASSVKNVLCQMICIPQKRGIYYLANTENGRKVIEENGRFFCEFDRNFYHSVELRFAFSVKLADFSGNFWAQVFNDEGKKLIGVSAEELDKTKKQSTGLFSIRLERNYWRPLLCRIRTKLVKRPQSEELRSQHWVNHVEEPDFVKETNYILDLIAYYL
eukprot:g8849.t1